MRHSLISLMILALSGFAAVRVDNVSALRTETGRLGPGDTLIVAAGDYEMSTWSLQNLRGAADSFIVILAEGRAVIKSNSTCCNLVQLGNTHYVKLSGFEITMVPGTGGGVDGVNLKGDSCSHIVLENLFIHDMSFEGVGLHVGASDITLRNSEIARCAGSALYWGYPGTCIVHDVVIERNYIHHCPADPQAVTGYGIQFKGWCYRARIENNVMHDVGAVTRCGIVVYYGKTPLAGDLPGDINVVRGNVLWNCRNEGITAMSDALVENNIVFDAEVGVNIQTYSDESFSGSNFVENLVVRNNTVFRCRSACASVSGWSAAGNGTAFTGNALYQETAGKTSFSGNTGAGLCRGNVYYGQSSTQNGFGQGAGLSDFAAVSASAAVSGLDFYPAAGAPVIDVLTQAPDWAQTDFNRTVRPYNGAGDAGAYEYTVPRNPGWRIAGGFKDSADAGIEGKLFPAGRVLCRNTPNPFYGATRISFCVPWSVDAGTARIVVFDVKGRRVANLPAEPAEPGTRASIWDGRDGLGRPAAEGVYYYELAAPGLAKKAGRMVRLR